MDCAYANMTNLPQWKTSLGSLMSLKLSAQAACNDSGPMRSLIAQETFDSVGFKGALQLLQFTIKLSVSKHKSKQHE